MDAFLSDPHLSRLLLVLGVAYAMGSVLFAPWVARWAGLPDVRSAGSRNPGATNMVRLAGKRWGAVVFVLDAAKGALPVGICQHWALIPPEWLGAVLVASVVGHVWPVWSGFKGGKGVATYAGGLLFWSPPAGIAWLLVWVVVFGLTRVSAWAALCASLGVWVGSRWWAISPEVPFVILVLLIVTHRANLSQALEAKKSVKP